MISTEMYAFVCDGDFQLLFEKFSTLKYIQHLNKN